MINLDYTNISDPMSWPEPKEYKENNMVNLGDKVKDPVTGFTGIAISRHFYLNGCDRITVQPKIGKDMKNPGSITFDEPQLQILKKNAITIKQATKLTGGPDKYMDEGR